MAEVWYTSDLHLGHELISRLRGFASTDDHDGVVLGNWRERVDPDDTVWVLGDVSLRRPTAWASVVSELPGRKHLVTGNHDACHPMHRGAQRHLRDYLEVFETVQPYARKRLDGRDVLLSHLPYRADHTADARYSQWRLPDEGSWLIHGHTHSTVKLTSDHEVNVCLEAWWLAPVAQGTIVNVMRGTSRWT